MTDENFANQPDAPIEFRAAITPSFIWGRNEDDKVRVFDKSQFTRVYQSLNEVAFGQTTENMRAWSAEVFGPENHDFSKCSLECMSDMVGMVRAHPALLSAMQEVAVTQFQARIQASGDDFAHIERINDFFAAWAGDLPNLGFIIPIDKLPEIVSSLRAAFAGATSYREDFEYALRQLSFKSRPAQSGAVARFDAN